MIARWDVKDDHLISRWTEIGSMTGFHPEWITKTPLREGQTHRWAVDLSTRSPFGGANWYAHELWERQSRRKK